MKKLLLMAMLLIGGLALSQTRTYKAQYYLWSFTYGLDVKDTLHVDVLKFDDGSILLSAPGPGGGGTGDVTQAELDSMSLYLLNAIAQHGLQGVLNAGDSATGNLNLVGWVNIDNGGMAIDQGSIYLTEGLNNRYHTTADGMGLQFMTNRDGTDTASYIINGKAATYFQHPSNPFPIVFRGSAGAGAGLYLLKMVPDSGIVGYYAGVPKFETTPEGIEVFGNVIADNILKTDTLSINANRQFISADKNKNLINRQAVTRTMTLTTGLEWDNYPVNIFTPAGGDVIVNAGTALMIGIGGDTLTTATVCYAATLYPIGPDTYFLLNGSCGSGGGIDSVATDNTLIGNGSTESPLGLPEAIPGKRIFDDLVASGQAEITAPGNTDENQNGNFRFRVNAQGALLVEKRVSGVWQECTSFNY